MKNLTVIHTLEAIDGIISLRNYAAQTEHYTLTFSTGNNSIRLPQEAEIRVHLDSTLYQAWQRGGGISTGIQLLGNQTVLLKNAEASLCNLIFKPYEFGILSVKFNFLTREMTPQTDYEFHVIQTDTNDNIMGGEVYSIIKSSRTPFYADAGEDIYTYTGAAILLNAAPISEPVTYNWYLNDSLVHTGISFSTSAVIGQKYKLEVIALADGYKDYAEVEIKPFTGQEEPTEPFISDLLIRDTECEGNPLFLNCPNDITWNSPDLCCRTSPDWIFEHENPVPNTTNYCYVRIKNSATNDSLQGIFYEHSSEEERLHLYWARTSTSSVWDIHWAEGFPFPDEPLLGIIQTNIPIPSIPPSEEIILEIPWLVPDFTDYYDFNEGHGNPEPWHWALLAIIGTLDIPPSPPEEENLHDYVKNKRTVAVKNLSIIQACMYSPEPQGAIVGIRSVPEISNYDLVILCDPESEPDCKEAEIIARMDPVLYDAWQSHGRTLTNNIIDIGNSIFMINSLHEPAAFSNIHLDSGKLGLLDLQFYPYGHPTCKYHVIQHDNTTGEIIGGKVYEVNLSNSFRSGTEDNTISTNRQNLFRSIQDTTNNELNISRIESIHPNPATHEITLTYLLNEVANASISISNYYFKGMSDNYILDINSRTKTVPVWNYTTGFYIVTLFCDGKVADMKTFIKH